MDFFFKPNEQNEQWLCKKKSNAKIDRNQQRDNLPIPFKSRAT